MAVCARGSRSGDGGYRLRAAALRATRNAVPWIALLLTVLLLLALLRAAALGTELFRVEVRGGRVELERGRLPAALLAEIEDVVRLYGLQQARISAVLSGGAAKLRFEHDGAAAAAEQPLRNVLGRFTVTQLRSGERKAR